MKKRVKNILLIISGTISVIGCASAQPVTEEGYNTTVNSESPVQRNVNELNRQEQERYRKIDASDIYQNRPK